MVDVNTFFGTDEFYGGNPNTTTTFPPWLPKNATILCKEIHVTDTWEISGLGAIITSALVLVTFTVFFFLHRNDGPQVWNSSWLPIFQGYLAMQFVAIFLYGYFFSFVTSWDWKGVLARSLFVILSWGGYWVVGQFLIVAPFVDMGCCKWKGCFKWLNLLLCAFMLCPYVYFEFLVDDPWDNKEFHQFFDFTRTLVYVGNVFVLVEVVYYKWYCKRPGFLIYLTTFINGFALWFTFKYVADPNFIRKNCLYYVLEAISLILIWRFFIITRDDVFSHLNPENYLNLNSMYVV